MLLNGTAVHVWRLMNFSRGQISHLFLQRAVTSRPVLIGTATTPLQSPGCCSFGFLETLVSTEKIRSLDSLWYSVPYLSKQDTIRVNLAQLSRSGTPQSRALRARILQILRRPRVSAAHLTISPFTSHPWTHNFLLWAHCLKRTSMRYSTARGRLAAGRSLAIPVVNAK